MNRRDTAGIILLLIVAGAAWATGEWWLFWSAAAAAAAVTLLRPVQRYYRSAPPRHQKLLIVANQGVAVAILVFYLWVARDLANGTQPLSTWIPWLLVIAVPAGLFLMGIAAWRRVGENTET